MLTSLLLTALIIAPPKAEPAAKDTRFAIQPILYTGKDGKFSKNYEQVIKIQLNEMNQFFRRTTRQTPIVLPAKRVTSDVMNKDLFSKVTLWRSQINSDIKPKAKQLTLIFTSGGKYIENFGKVDAGYQGITIISERALIDPNRPPMDSAIVGNYLRAICQGMGLIRPALEIAPTVMLMPGDYPEVTLMPHEVQALRNSPWFNLAPISTEVPSVDPNDIPDFVSPKTKITLNNIKFVKGDKVEFTGVRIEPNGNLFKDKSVTSMVEIKIVNNVATFTIPNEAPSGFVRFWRGNKSGWSIPIFIAE